MNTAKNDSVWQTAELSRTYLEGVRGAIPLAGQQIDVMLHLIRAARPNLDTVLDLGCGDGILGQAVLAQYPAAHGVFVDFSQPMLDAARKRLADTGQRATFVSADYGKKNWQDKLSESGRRQFDAIVSGFSIHHQPHARKKEVYAELYELLKPGGIFLNLEHVASPTRWVEKRFEEHFIDALVAYHEASDSGKTPAEVASDYYNRPDKTANILAPVDTQCQWLRQIGFEHVDCFLKLFELALFGGIKPATSHEEASMSLHAHHHLGK